MSYSIGQWQRDADDAAGAAGSAEQYAAQAVEEIDRLLDHLRAAESEIDRLEAVIDDRDQEIADLDRKLEAL